MSNPLIEKALQSANETKAIEVGYDVLGKTGEMFKKLFPGATCQVVADENTFAAAGEEVVASLEAAGVNLAEPYIFPGTPTLYGGYENVEKLREFLKDKDVIVCSIASGTLNDIAKLASGELGREYMNVCTAPSVDGYAAFGASIAKDGFKITRNCPAPAGLVADYQVMADSPKRLIATGYGDLIEKIPAGADWIAADELGVEKIDDYVWSLVQGPLRDALKDPELIGQGKAAAIEGLTDGNIMSGLAMQAAKSSRPASGYGHQFSHTWEMEGHGLDWEPPLSHGFKVAVGTVSSLAVWEEALKLNMDDIDVDQVVANAPTWEEKEKFIRSQHVSSVVESAVTQSKEKHLEGEALRQRVQAIKDAWPRITARVKKQVISPAEAQEWLKAVGAPYHPQMIEIDWQRFHETHFKAGHIRARYTIYDVLQELGVFDQIVENLFAPDGFWGKQAPENQ